MATDDDFDPCAEYIELRQAYLDILKNKSVKKVRFRNGEDERETEFNSANIQLLKEAMNNMQALCLAKDGGRPRRFAIGIGNNSKFPRGIY